MKLNTIKNIWQELNARNFGGVLAAPRIRWHRHHSEAAKYNGVVIFVSRGMPISETRETLYHEMVHQYIAEFLEIDETPHHNGLFRKTYTKFLTDDIERDSDYAI